MRIKSGKQAPMYCSRCVKSMLDMILNNPDECVTSFTSFLDSGRTQGSTWYYKIWTPHFSIHNLLSNASLPASKLQENATFQILSSNDLNSTTQQTSKRLASIWKFTTSNEQDVENHQRLKGSRESNLNRAEVRNGTWRVGK